MLTLTGNLLTVVKAPPTINQKTGEYISKCTAQVLDQSANGKFDVIDVSIDQSVYDDWIKCAGKQISINVRIYAMSDDKGSVRSGLSLADKKSLPTLIES